MGALDAREAVVKTPSGTLREKLPFDVASEFVIFPIVVALCSCSVGTVEASVMCILIAPSSVTCCEET